MPRNPLIGFNSDDETKRLANILAAKLRFDNVSDMMRDLLRRAFKDNFTPKQISELLGIPLAAAQAMLDSDADDGDSSSKANGRNKHAA